ncbi:MAG: hypothetical protein ACOY90_18035 [Candidatus Zhuqueibacterota bacterium]
MKQHLSLFLVVALWHSLALAQIEKENSLRWFQGGTVTADFSFRTDMFSGIGSKAYMGCASMNSDASAIYWNPATLAFRTNRQVLVSFMPPLSLSIANWYDIAGQVRTSVDNAIADYRLSETGITYPTVTPVVRHRGGINTAVIVMPLSRWLARTVLGLGYSRALELQMNLVANGISSLLETRKNIGTQTMVVKFRNSIDANVESRAAINRFSVAAAHQWTPILATGITLDRYFGEVLFNGDFRIDGIMETAGSEFAFNDPYDPHINFEEGEQNNLNQSIYCSFKGNAWGVKLGADYHLRPNLSFAAMVEIAPTLTLSGVMDVDNNIIPALNSDVLLGNSEEEIMDPSKLDLAKLTLTVPYENPTDDRLILRFPSSANFGVTYRWACITGSLQVTGYFGELSYATLGTRRGADFKWSLRNGLDFKYVQIGLGVVAVDEIREGTDDDAGAVENILIPQCSLGTGFSLGRFARTETQAFIAPTPVFKQVLLFNF